MQALQLSTDVFELEVQANDAAYLTHRKHVAKLAQV